MTATACGQLGTLSPTVTEGQQFAHSVQFPSAFRAPDRPKQLLPLQFDHYTFRVSAMFPDVLLVTACRYVGLSEVCSVNGFAIDTAHSYSVRELERNEWESASPTDLRNMYNPLPEEPYKNLAPIAARQGEEYQGYKYQGKEYPRRGDWIVTLSFAGSEDAKLIVLAGVDKRRFRNQEPGLVSSAVETGLSGLVTVDASDPSHHIASLDLDCHTNVNLARRRVSLVNSRWVAIGLDAGFQKMLLFDFKSLEGQ